MTLLIGILGASDIAPSVILRPASLRDDVRVVAVGSRRAEKASDYAAKWGIPRSYGSYQEVIDDPEVQLVYNALPPSEHASWSIAALEAGKDVLCEKPFAMNAEQARDMNAVAVRTGKRLIEAFHDRYHPLSLELDRIKESGRLGDIVSLRAVFDAPIPYEEGALRHTPSLGGGALMDLGCYVVHWVRALVGEEPTFTEASMVLNPLGADRSFTATGRFPSGIDVTLSASMDVESVSSTFEIVGTEGTVHVENMIFPSAGHSITEQVGDLVKHRTVAGMETYDHQLAAVIAALASGESLPTEGEDSIGNMAVIDAIYRAAGVDRTDFATSQ